MRILAVLVALGALFQCAIARTSIAGTSECKSISNHGARLACYDRAATSAPAKPALKPLPASNVDGDKYVDKIGAEDALMNARLKNICRGC
jgi:hypothetical protein